MSDDRPRPDPDPRPERNQADSAAGARSGAPGRDAAEDLEMGAALGRALRERPETAWTAPPVALIEERAAARSRARAARRTVAAVAAAAAVIVGAAVVWNGLDGDGPGTVVVSPDDPAAADPDGPGPDNPAAADGASPAEADGPATGAAADGPTKLSDPPAAEDGRPAPPDRPTPEELSTGPGLQWTEIDPGVQLDRIESVGDGRIIAGIWPDSAGDAPDAPHIVVTTDGIAWTEVPMPSGIVPGELDISGGRWLVTGHDVGSNPFRGTPGRAFFSDDEGATWTELALDLPPTPAPASPHVIEDSGVTSAQVSGDNMVLVVSSGRHLDLHGLLEDRGLVPEGKLLVGWGQSRDSSIELRLADGAEFGAIPGEAGTDEAGAVEAGTDKAGAVEYMPGSTPVESMSLTYAELGMTDEERAVFDDPGPGQVFVYASDGSTVELVATHEGWAWRGVATDEGFILGVGSPAETVLTSTDGRSWSEVPLLGGGHSPWVVGPAGAIWQLGWDGRLSIRRAGFAEAFATVAGFEGLEPAGGLTAGPAGLVAAATPAPDPIDNLRVGFPVGRVAKGGYELRYNEPEFGVTLWDLEADAAVYVFTAEDIVDGGPPEGVRESSDGGDFAIVFEDPESGADLVTFTYEDLAPVFEAGSFEAGNFEAGSDFYDVATVDVGAYEPPEMWVGWSADGTAWGWQRLNDAFGIDDGESWAQFAVGADFVLAQVHTIPVAAVLGSAGGQGGPPAIEGSESSGSAGVVGGVIGAWEGAGEPQPPRWFIGRAPQSPSG